MELIYSTKFEVYAAFHLEVRHDPPYDLNHDPLLFDIETGSWVAWATFMLILDFQLAATSWSPDMHVQDRQMDCNLQWHLARTRRFHNMHVHDRQMDCNLQWHLARTRRFHNMHVQDRQMDCNLQWHLARTRRFHDKASSSCKAKLT